MTDPDPKEQMPPMGGFHTNELYFAFAALAIVAGGFLFAFLGQGCSAECTVQQKATPTNTSSPAGNANAPADNVTGNSAETNAT